MRNGERQRVAAAEFGVALIVLAYVLTVLVFAAFAFTDIAAP